MIFFHVHNVDRAGTVWHSPDVFEGPDPYYVQKFVYNGWIIGSSYWATHADGAFLYGLDAKGKPMAAAPVVQP